MGCRCCCIRRSPRSSSSGPGQHRKKRWLRPCADVASAHGGGSHRTGDVRRNRGRRSAGDRLDPRMGRWDACCVGRRPASRTAARHGVTLGGPIAVEIGNTEWPKWETVMATDPVDPAELEDSARNAPLTRPRPGHADYAGMLKYGFDDARPVLERASARETAARVAAGTIARGLRGPALGVEVLSHVTSIAASKPYDGPPPQPSDLDAIDASPVRAYDKAAERAMIDEVEAAKKDGDTLGGVAEVAAQDLPVGLGSFTSGDSRLDSQLAAAVMGIQAIKGVEIRSEE